MEREREVIQSLSPFWQHRMAELVFAGWVFKLESLQSYTYGQHWSARNDNFTSRWDGSLQGLLVQVDKAERRGGPEP